ncbi:hypothetical protein ABT282_07035 [Streptomyces sp. NPDC000927]|uniref:hypothetical protein n=1 Tax=Streptomyces sp. NPDC000927 TaxID=3154371 RepID=UPI003323443F
MEEAKYRVSVRCNLCDDRQDMPMKLTREAVETIRLLGQVLTEESDWNKTITIYGPEGSKDISGATPEGSGILVSHGWSGS